VVLPMRPVFAVAPFVLWLGMPNALIAQKDKPEPLTEAQIEQIREAGIDPNGRLVLYTKFINDHEELQDLTALMDEFGSNLDTYSDRHADIRKALKALTGETDHWLSVLKALPGEAGFDLARKEAIESEEDLADQAKRLLSEQTEYFNLHKDEQGQERAEPKQ
jgi:hypothetical protein